MLYLIVCKSQELFVIQIKTRLNAKHTAFNTKILLNLDSILYNFHYSCGEKDSSDNCGGDRVNYVACGELKVRCLITV